MAYILIILLIIIVFIVIRNLFKGKNMGLFSSIKKGTETLTGKNVERLVNEHIDIQGTILIGMHKEIDDLKNKINRLNQNVGTLSIRIESLENSKRKSTLLYSLLTINTFLIFFLIIQLQWKIIPGFLN